MQLAMCGGVMYCSRRILGFSKASTPWRNSSSFFSFMAAILLGVVPREDGKDGVAESGLLGDEVAVGLIDDGDDWSRGFGPAHLHVLEGGNGHDERRTSRL